MSIGQPPPQFKPTTTLSDVEKTIEEYVKYIKTKPNIVFPDNARLYIHTSTNVGECEKKFLVVYKYGMPSLEYEVFRKIPILLLDTEQYQVTHDHFYYWAFATEVYDHLQGKINHIYD